MVIRCNQTSCHYCQGFWRRKIAPQSRVLAVTELFTSGIQYNLLPGTSTLKASFHYGILTVFSIVFYGPLTPRESDSENFLWYLLVILWSSLLFLWPFRFRFGVNRPLFMRQSIIIHQYSTTDLWPGTATKKSVSAAWTFGCNYFCPEVVSAVLRFFWGGEVKKK